jgi:hypothetical protein
MFLTLLAPQNTPTPLGNTFWINVSGTWVQATPYVKVSGVWKQATPKINLGGIWM